MVQKTAMSQKAMDFNASPVGRTVSPMRELGAYEALWMQSGATFKRVAEIEGDDSKDKGLRPFDLLRTHPPTAERAALVRSQPDYPATPALDDADWQALKDVCKTTVNAEK